MLALMFARTITLALLAQRFTRNASELQRIHANFSRISSRPAECSILASGGAGAAHCMVPPA